jgi:hypothetical protein
MLENGKIYMSRNKQIPRKRKQNGRAGYECDEGWTTDITKIKLYGSESIHPILRCAYHIDQQKWIYYQAKPPTEQKLNDIKKIQSAFGCWSYIRRADGYIYLFTAGTCSIVNVSNPLHWYIVAQFNLDQHHNAIII